MFYDKVDEEGERETPEQVFKIIIIGDSGVGKTCLAHRFATGKFPERTEATIGVDFWERRLELNGAHIRVSLFDFILVCAKCLVLFFSNCHGLMFFFLILCGIDVLKFCYIILI